LVFHSSTIAMMHGPINIRFTFVLFIGRVCVVSPSCRKNELCFKWPVSIEVGTSIPPCPAQSNACWLPKSARVAYVHKMRL